MTEDGAVGTGWRWPGPERVRDHPGPEMIRDGGSHYACLRASRWTGERVPGAVSASE